jgi:hypothetical protein
LASVGTVVLVVVVAADNIAAVGGMLPGRGYCSVQSSRTAMVVPVETETRESSFAMPISFFGWVLVRVQFFLAR